MNLFSITVYVTAGLTAIVLGLLVLIMVLNIVWDQRIAVNRYLRSKMIPVLQQYLAGTAQEQAALNELERDRETALECLVETASTLSLGARQQLRVFFDYFRFEPSLIDEIRSRNWSKRLEAATRMGFTGNRDFIAPLSEALKDDMLDVRLAAAQGLAQLGASGEVKAILQSLPLNGSLPQQMAAEILFEMGGPAVLPMMEYLREEHQEEENTALAVAVRALGLMKAKSAAPQIVPLLKHSDSEVRLNSARALGLMGAADAIQALCQRLGDPVWEVRSTAVQALGNLKNPITVPTLVIALGDQAWWVRYNAAQALFQLGDPGIDALKKAMAINSDAFARDISRQILEEHGVIATEGETKS